MNLPSFEKSMQAAELLTCSQFLGAIALEKGEAQGQESFKTLGQTCDPLQATRYAYEQLSDSDKWPFCSQKAFTNRH